MVSIYTFRFVTNAQIVENVIDECLRIERITGR